MAYTSLRNAVDDLERHGQLKRISREVDPYLEMAEIHRRVYQNQGPALFFEKVKGSPFPAVSNLFGTLDRAELLLRSSFEAAKKVVQLKADPGQFWRAPMAFAQAPWTALKALPWKRPTGPVLAKTTGIKMLPQIQCWPDDGGPFITLPQVYSEDPEHPDLYHSNLGMYRLQMAGNEYLPEKELGFHYQIHRGIGIHHTKAVSRGEPLTVSIFIGGPPAHTLAAVMPLPEGLTELLFAGIFANRRFRYTRRNGHLISTEADFCITGTVDPQRLRPEGPFGDHLGYYSLKHPFPVLDVKTVYHRRGAIWPFTVVGRPPQEDTTFGKIIHELTAPMVPKEIPGLRAIHAVDAAGVHPLLLAIGSERYVPFDQRHPREILTIANALLGFGQCSLAKYLFIVAGEDNPDLDVHDIPDFFRHLLERVDWTRDLHFQTRTTMDTLDYSGTALNAGSKLIIAAAGEPKRRLATQGPDRLTLPEGFAGPVMPMPGALLLKGPQFDPSGADKEVDRLVKTLEAQSGLRGFPLLVLVDDLDFCAKELKNFLWVTFTRSNPSHDVHGVRSFIENKHWGCEGPLIIDARIKPHHAPPLTEDPEVSRKVDHLALPGGPLHGII